jgi:hypothetical protein
MKNAEFSALQDRIKRFGRIVVRIATNKFFLRVIDPVMTSIVLSNSAIDMELIRHQMRVFVHKLVDYRHKVFNAITWNRRRPNRAAALHRHQHSLLFGTSTAFVLNTMLKAWLAAEIFFIQLHYAAEGGLQLPARVHHFANGMTQFPSTLLGDANPLGQEHRGDAFTCNPIGFGAMAV